MTSLVSTVLLERLVLPKSGSQSHATAYAQQAEAVVLGSEQSGDLPLSYVVLA